MIGHVIDFFKIEGDREVVATLVDDELQAGAPREFLDLRHRRPQELIYHARDPEPGFDGCVLSASATLEEDPSGYLGALSDWLYDHRYTFQGTPEQGMRKAKRCLT